LAFAFAGIWFAISAKTAHLPPVLQVIGAMLAIGVAALIGSARTKFGLCGCSTLWSCPAGHA